jgi:hypothetical protein
MRLLCSMFLGLVLLSCVKSIPQVTKIYVTKKQGYCLRGEAKYRGKVEKVELCTETLLGCKKAEELAIKFGSLANLNKIDRCTASQP